MLQSRIAKSLPLFINKTVNLFWETLTLIKSVFSSKLIVSNKLFDASKKVKFTNPSIPVKSVMLLPLTIKDVTASASDTRILPAISFVS